MLTTLALAALSGCAELPEDAALEDVVPPEAAAEAAALADQVSKAPGHIAGQVLDASLVPVAGATVSIASLERTRTTDSDGSFSFVDLAAGSYLLNVAADGFQQAEALVEVKPSQFSRPTVGLVPVPPPEMTYEVFKFEGYSDVGVPLFGCFSCYRSFGFEIAQDGLTEMVLEAVVQEGTLTGSSHLTYFLGLYGEEDSLYYDGSENAPLRVVLPVGEDAGELTDGYLDIQLEHGVMPELSQEYTVYLTLVYNGVAPEGYTAMAEDA